MIVAVSVTSAHCTQIEGLENLPPSGQPAVYISNHQSFLVGYKCIYPVKQVSRYLRMPDGHRACVAGYFHPLSSQPLVQVCIQDQQLLDSHHWLEHVSDR